MEVRGSILQSVAKFVRSKFGEDGWDHWLAKVTGTAREIYVGTIDPERWYPLKATLIEPTANVAQLFYNWDLKKAAWDLGRFSADFKFKGARKILVKIPSPNYYIRKGVEFLPSFYRPAKLNVEENREGFARVRVTLFPDMDTTTQFRIAGWMQRGLELNGCKNVEVQITKALTNFDPYSEYQVSWAMKR